MDEYTKYDNLYKTKKYSNVKDKRKPPSLNKLNKVEQQKKRQRTQKIITKKQTSNRILKIE